MHLIDRPALAHEVVQHRTGGVSASVGLHIIALAALIAIMRSAPGPTTSPTAVDTGIPPFTWIAAIDIGGGKSGGGDQSVAPPIRIREIGHDSTSVKPDASKPSDHSTIDPPEDTATIPAKPTGDANVELAGAIESSGVSSALGPGDTGVGSTPGNDRGALGKFGDGIGPGALRGGPGVTMPTLIQQVKPRYTADAMRLRIQGSVWVECIVLPDGTVSDARVIRSLDSKYGLDDEAIAAAKQWRFRPGLLNGKPVPVVVSIELMFSVR